MLLLYRLAVIYHSGIGFPFTFHYASTISLCTFVIRVNLLIFTFHYASTISEPFFIYIVFSAYFTFHYASTISFLPFPFAVYIISFTFHYASTISRHAARDTAAEPPLHSTMLLLYHNWCYWQVRWLLLYIPLCFYYITPLKIQIDTKISFTFHYASTISMR